MNVVFFIFFDKMNVVNYDINPGFNRIRYSCTNSL